MNKLWCVHTMDTVLCFLCLVAQSGPTLCYLMDCSLPGSSVHGDSPSKNAGVACHALLQGLIPTQGLNPSLLHCRWIFYHLSHQGSPRIQEWVAYPFSRWTFWPRIWTSFSYIAGVFFTSWATQEAHNGYYSVRKKNEPIKPWKDMQEL